MLLPYNPPPPAEGARLPSPPALWRRARDLLAALTAHIGQLTVFARRTLSLDGKREVLGWLEPLEKQVRASLILRALNFLLMTPAGRRLMRETPRSPPPRKPQPPTATGVLTIPSPGWSTIAQHRAAQAAEQAEQATAAGMRDGDPDEASSAFRVIRWRFPTDADTPQPPPRPASRTSLIALFDANPFPRLIIPSRETPPEPEARFLARRIAAVGRIIASPARPAARLARLFARLPREALQGLTETYLHTRPWWRHGVAEAYAAFAHVRRAACALLLHPEPG